MCVGAFSVAVQLQRACQTPLFCLHGSDRLTVLCRAAASLYAPAAGSARDLLGGGRGLRARLDMAADGTTLKQSDGAD